MEEGVDILLVGMTAVFAFLALLIGLLSVSGRLFQRFAPPPAPRSDAASDRAVAAAVAAAWRHRLAARDPRPQP